jgi:hypothetical protein
MSWSRRASRVVKRCEGFLQAQTPPLCTTGRRGTRHRALPGCMLKPSASWIRRLNDSILAGGQRLDKGKMASKNSVVLEAPFVRRLPAPSDAPQNLASVQTYIFRIRAKDIPAGIPDDANPREPNLNRQVYRNVRSSLRGDEGDTGSFHLKHGGIVIVAESVRKQGDETHYELSFNPDPEVKQGIVNGNHSYRLLLDAKSSDNIPANQYVEIKVYVGVPPELVPDLAEGLNSSMQVHEESLADLREQFNWLKDSLKAHPQGIEAISWHEGNNPDTMEYDIREVIALLMALDPKRYPLDNPVGIENTYARLSSVFRSYLTDVNNKTRRVEQFASIALEALQLYEYIRYSAARLWQGATPGDGRGHFHRTKLADNAKNPNSPFRFPFLLDESGNARTSEVRLTKAAAVPCFTAFRVLVNAPSVGEVKWRYPFADIRTMWDQLGAEVLREAYDVVTKQFNGTTHYAGRSIMLYRATTKTLELADLRRRVGT